eukprot:TRINITY_DN5488_c1_g1_i5.p2 TRINITY_DN5488_c1_g1~~TRINITY_DN5488_c1_g1_i5.p2  ORF type:complete len:192 (-),score=38.92 TRINITY_DN5488_c1_g1_i5:377-952(-)
MGNQQPRFKERETSVATAALVVGTAAAVGMGISWLVDNLQQRETVQQENTEHYYPSERPKRMKNPEQQMSTLNQIKSEIQQLESLAATGRFEELSSSNRLKILQNELYNLMKDCTTDNQKLAELLQNRLSILQSLLEKHMSPTPTPTTTPISSLSTPYPDLDCPDSFLCPITQDIMRDPVLLAESGIVSII